MNGLTVVSIGDIVVDLNAAVKFPIEAGRVIISDHPLLEPGGACNFAITAARLGLNCVMIGAPGADLFGDLVIQILQSEQVDTSLIRQFQDVQTTLVFVLADPGTLQHTFLSSRLNAHSIYAFDAQVEAALNSAQALYFQGYTLVENSIWEVTRRSLLHVLDRIPIYFDPGPLLVNAPHERQRFAVEHTDVILTTEEELFVLSPGLSDVETAARNLLSSHPRMVIIKRNISGCRIVTPDGAHDFPAYPVQAISTVAAGDAFNAGFIAARLHGCSDEDSARIANATGAAKVRRIGGGRNVPHLDDVRRVLQSNGVDLSLADWKAS